MIRFGRLAFAFLGLLSSLPKTQYSRSISDISMNLQATILSTSARGTGGRPSPTHIIEESLAGGIVSDHGSSFEVPGPKPAWLNGAVIDCVVETVVIAPVEVLLPRGLPCPVPSVGRSASSGITPRGPGGNET